MTVLASQGMSGWFHSVHANRPVVESSGVA